MAINNAGMGNVGEVEGTEDAVARWMFEVNFWGAGNVSRAAVRFFREENPKGLRGTLLVVSSLVGRTASPGLGYYSAR